MDVDVEVDHYNVLGLPSGEEGSKLTEKEISKAYKLKALELHPDKRTDDHNAHENFHKLKFSYEILKDENARKLFDDILRVKRQRRERRGQQDAKRRKMMSDLEERERAAFAYSHPAAMQKEREEDEEEEEDVVRSFHQEIKKIRAMVEAMREKSTVISDEEREKILKVTWKNVGSQNYSAKRLRELFSKFGEVGDVVMKKATKKRGLALVAMTTKDAAVAAMGNVYGNLSHPLLVSPYQKVEATTYPAREFDGLQNFVAIDHEAREDFVLGKLQEAAEIQKTKCVSTIQGKYQNYGSLSISLCTCLPNWHSNKRIIICWLLSCLT